MLTLEDPKAGVKEIEKATLIRFPGGDQSRLMRALDDAKVSDAIRTRHEAGAVIAGTSARGDHVENDAFRRRTKNNRAVAGIFSK